MNKSIAKYVGSIFLTGFVAAALIAIPGKAANAAGSVKIDKTNFPDEGFRKYVSDKFDENGDGQLSAAEIKKVTKMRTDWSTMAKDAKGIEFFTELTELEWTEDGGGSYHIKSLDLTKNTKLKSVTTSLTYMLSSVNVSNCKDLRTLRLGSGNLKSLDVSKNTKLTYLSFSGTQMTKIDLSNNKELEYLNCTGSGLKSLDISHNPKLKILECYLTDDDPGLAITSLDFSKNPEIQDIRCMNIPLTSINLKNCSKLANLMCEYGELTKLDLTDCVNLTNLSCWGNKIKTLDLRKNTKLNVLGCGNGQLTSLDLSKCNELTQVNCCNARKMTSLNIKDCDKLMYFNCAKTAVKKLDISDSPTLVELYTKGTKKEYSDEGIKYYTYRLPETNDEANLSVNASTKIVSSKPKTVVTLTRDNLTATVVCGYPLELKPKILGTDKNITWKSSDSKIASVDTKGLVTTKMAGTVTITATAAGKKVTCKVTVLYKDVTDSKEFWFIPTNYLTAKGVVKGYDKQTKFKPANDCTRAQMVTFLYRLQGEPKTKSTTCKFNDVKKTDYFFKPVIWAVEQGVTTGVSKTKFNPQGVCTRAQTVTFLWRMAGKPNPKSTKNPFPDVKQKDYYYTATLWASEKKILAGLPDGTFNPKGKCLRRQMVTFLYKYDKYVNKKG